MKTKTISTLLSLFVALSLFAQPKEIQTITENDLRAHLEFIASDYMQGREFTTPVPGLDITAEYLKTQCELMGIKPGVDGYFQNVEMEVLKPDLENTWCKVMNEAGDVQSTFPDIYSFIGPSNGDTIESDVVFAGYGWYDEKTKYNDTEGIDVKGKIVLAMTRNIELCADSASDALSVNVEMRKMNKMLMGGARALVLVPDPLNPNTDEFDGVKKYALGGTFSLKGANGRQSLPMSLVLGTTELADGLLAASGKTLAQLQKEINDSGSPKSIVVQNTRAKIQLPKDKSDITGRNVVAIVEGRDPVLKNECIVLSAHYDHLGMNAEGEVFNGADDNGTGTVALLEIAQAFQAMKKKPRRSVVFVWVTAEEKGLFGSNFYSQFPIIPLEKTVANVNLDMVGRSAETEPVLTDDKEKKLAGPDGLYVITGNQSSELAKISNDVSEKMGLVLDDSLSKEFLTRSDYYHFYKNGVPVLGLSTGLHEDYHKTTDELDKIDYAKMKRVTQYAFSVAHEVANQKDRLVVDNPSNE